MTAQYIFRLVYFENEKLDCVILRGRVGYYESSKNSKFWDFRTIEREDSDKSVPAIGKCVNNYMNNCLKHNLFF